MRHKGTPPPLLSHGSLHSSESWLSICSQIWSCARLCGFMAGDPPPHLAALVSAALRALLPAHSPAQRAAVAALGCMLQNCSGKKKKAIRLAGFVNAAIHWLPSFRSTFTHMWVLQAAIQLARPQQLTPLMAVLLLDLMDADVNEGMLHAAVEALDLTIRCWNLPLGELFGSDETAAGVATRLVQLLAHPSNEILPTAWQICSHLWNDGVDQQLLLNAGLLQPTHFAQAMASSYGGVRFNSILFLSFFTFNDSMAHDIVEHGLIPDILTGCDDTNAAVVRCALTTLFCCVKVADQPDAAQLRPIVLQACTAAAFPSANVTHLVRAGQLTDFFQKLIRTLRLVLQWPESVVDSARLHPLAQRLVDAGLLPHIEGQSHRRT